MAPVNYLSNSPQFMFVLFTINVQNYNNINLSAEWTESSLNKIHRFRIKIDMHQRFIWINRLNDMLWSQENYHAWLMIDIDNQYTFYRHIILTVMLRIKMWIKYSFSRHKVSVYLIDLYLRLQSIRYVTCFHPYLCQWMRAWWWWQQGCLPPTARRIDQYLWFLGQGE